jgi:endonuclease-3
MEDLISLAGVGRKTASVVQSVVFNIPAIAVDVHVHRLALRLGWSKAKLPAGTEKDLLALIPPASHNVVNRVFVKLGRYICLPSKPRCAICPLQDICPYGAKNLTLPKSESELWADIKRKEDYLQALRAPLTKVK